MAAVDGGIEMERLEGAPSPIPMYIIRSGAILGICAGCHVSGKDRVASRGLEPLAPAMFTQCSTNELTGCLPLSAMKPRLSRRLKSRGHINLRTDFSLEEPFDGFEINVALLPLRQLEEFAPDS